jgi:hypothetical protein
VTRRLSVWLAGAAVLLTVLALVGCVVAVTVTPAKAAGHPGFVAGTACDATGCHDSATAKFQHKEPYLGPCDVCHTLDRWSPAVYTHKDASFDNGMHPLIGCAMCHTEGKPLPSKECSSCHEAPHEGSKTCVNCHTTTAWGMRKPLPDDHVSLLGGHSKLECFDCHDTSKTPAKPRTCTNCHGTNHGGLTNCQSCHDPSTGWEPKEGWSHSSFFKITGQHKKLDCTDCHKNGRFANTPKVCVGCHGKKHGGLTDCASCHTTAGFGSTTFRHSSVFALTGRHAKLKCTSCHADNQFARVLGNGSHQCVSCHGPQHGGLRDCADCHTTAGFEDTTFRHQTVFPLIGHHSTLACSQCHIGGEFLPLPSKVCAVCHAPDNPHNGGVPPCQDCHSPAAPGGFNDVPHYTAHPIPLGGTHADTTHCDRCHVALHFGATPTPCATCHGTSGTAAVLVPHVGPSDCLHCHWPTAWDDVHFVHPAVLYGSGLAGLPDNPHRTSTTWGTYGGGSFGTYPTGCAKCHPGPGSNPDFTGHSCGLGAPGCH